MEYCSAYNTSCTDVMWKTSVSSTDLLQCEFVSVHGTALVADRPWQESKLKIIGAG